MAKILIQSRFTVDDGEAALAFYEAAFGARIVYRLENIRPDVVARLAEGDAEFWVSDGDDRGHVRSRPTSAAPPVAAWRPGQPLGRPDLPESRQSA